MTKTVHAKIFSVFLKYSLPVYCLLN